MTLYSEIFVKSLKTSLDILLHVAISLVMYSADEWAAVSSFLERALPAEGIIIQAAPEYFSTSEIFVRDNTYFMSVASLYTLGAPQYYRLDDGTRVLPISYSGCFSIYWYKRVTAKAIVEAPLQINLTK